MLNWIICGWFAGAIVSWTGIVAYWRKLLGLSWKDYVLRWTFGFQELPKAILYVAIWPVHLAIVIRNAIMVKKIQRELENNFSSPY